MGSWNTEIYIYIFVVPVTPQQNALFRSRNNFGNSITKKNSYADCTDDKMLQIR